MVTGVTRRALNVLLRTERESSGHRSNEACRNHRSERASERKRGSCDGERGREKEPHRAEGVETERVRERKSVQLLRVLRVSGGEKIFFSF